MDTALRTGCGMLAAVAATPVASALYAVAAALWLGAKAADLAPAAYSGFFLGLFGMLPAALLVLVYGLPAYLLLRRLRLANAGSLIAVANLPWALLISADPALLWVSWHATFATITFWLFVRHLPPTTRSSGQA